MRSEQEVSRAIDRYADTVQRLCMIYLKNQADTEDIFQTVFLKYATSTVAFESEEHEKAWLIRVTINACKDLLRSFFRSRTVSMEEVLEAFSTLLKICILYPTLLWILVQPCPPTLGRCWKQSWPFPKNTGTWSICTTTRGTLPLKSAGFWARTSTRFTPC